MLNVMNGQPCTISYPDLIRADIILSFEIEIGHVRGEMLSYSEVWIPVEIHTSGRSRIISMRLSLLVTRVRLVEPIVAIKGNVAWTVTDLAHGSV